MSFRITRARRSPGSVSVGAGERSPGAVDTAGMRGEPGSWGRFCPASSTRRVAHFSRSEVT